MCYRYGLKPSEFWNSTYRELHVFVNANVKRREDEYKQEIVLFDALGDKIIDVIGRQKAKYTSLVKHRFKDLFKEELEPESHQQTIEEQIRILRSMK